jgi:hypothetical protein
MKLPNADRSQISMDKLVGYCLNLEHPRGKDKARVFQSCLGITADKADILYDLIQNAAVLGEVVQQTTTRLGEVYKVDWVIPDTENIQLRTIWEITTQNSNPRLISAFIK